MSDKNTGGPAFPMVSRYRQSTSGYPHLQAESFSDGMTLRDYFAAKAMSGICAGYSSSDNGDSWPEMGEVNGCGESQFDVVASYSYAMADAMLRAREA